MKNGLYNLKWGMGRVHVSYPVGAHPRTLGDSPVEEIPRYVRIPMHQRNTKQKSHGRTRITVRDQYEPVRAIRS